jgi:hypothetical protein
MTSRLDPIETAILYFELFLLDAFNWACVLKLPVVRCLYRKFVPYSHIVKGYHCGGR